MTNHPDNKLRKVLILEVLSGGGHLSISQAIVQSLDQYPNIEPIRANIGPEIFDKLYALSSRQFIHLWSLFYKSIDSKRRANFAAKVNLTLQRQRLTNLIQKHQPHLILSNTHQAVKEVASVLNELHLKTPFLVFVPDPFTPPAVCFTDKATLTLVPTLTTYQKALTNDIPPQRLILTGHPVRQEFFHPPTNIDKHRRQLGLKPKLTCILFGGSGFGAEKMIEILFHLGAKPNKKLLKYIIHEAENHLNKDLKTIAHELFLNNGTSEPASSPSPHPTTPFQAIFITGTNKRLKSQLEQLTFPQHITPHIYGLVKNMSDFVHASDLIVGKAGPNIIFESVAASKPFLATYHIKGQEDGNIDFIRSTQVGFVEEHPSAAAQLIQIILENPQILKSTHPHIKHVRKQLQPAAQNIAQQIIKHLP